MQTHLALMQALLAQHGGSGRILNGSPVDGGYNGNWANAAHTARVGFQHTLAPNDGYSMLNPLHGLAQQLLSNTKNPAYSNRDALLQRFMQNSGAQ